MFPWRYDQHEVCCALQGRDTATPDAGGGPVAAGEGELVTFPESMDLIWEIYPDFRKHYRFG